MLWAIKPIIQLSTLMEFRFLFELHQVCLFFDLSFSIFKKILITISKYQIATCESGFLELSNQTCSELTSCTGNYALAVIDPLKTEMPTSLVPGRVAGTNSLEIVVQHPAVKGRVVKSIVLNATNADCNYPGANWFHGLDPTSQVLEVLAARVETLRGRGIAADRIVLDPGIGFGKTVEHNFELLPRQRSMK